MPLFGGYKPNVITAEVRSSASAASNVALIAASSSARIVVTRVTVTLSAATTVNAGYRIGFHATTTPTTTGVLSSHGALSPGSGIVEGDGSSAIGVGAAGDALLITHDVATSGLLRVVVTYYTVAE
jgi:hypothetical protein